MKVKDIMKKDIISVNIGATLKEVVEKLFKNQISGLLVMDGDNLAGIISEKDVYRIMYPKYEDFYSHPEIAVNYEEMESRAKRVKDVKVEKFMKSSIITLNPEDPVLKAGAVMLTRKVNRLPVMSEEEKVIGIVSRRDIYQAIFKQELDIGN